MYDAWHALAWSCVRICPDLLLSDRSFERQPLANMYSLALFFYRKSLVGPPRPRFCCLQYSIMSYVRSCCTTACYRRVVLLLHTTPNEMLRFLLASLLTVSLRSSCYYCCSCTTAQMLLLWFLLSVFSYIIKINPDPRKNHCYGK